MREGDAVGSPSPFSLSTQGGNHMKAYIAIADRIVIEKIEEELTEDILEARKAHLLEQIALIKRKSEAHAIGLRIERQSRDEDILLQLNGVVGY